MNPETKVENRLVSLIKKNLPSAFIWKVQQKSIRGAPDRNLIYKGLFSALEVKTGNGEATPIQKFWLANIEEAGGLSRVVNEENLESVVKELMELEVCEKCGRTLPGKKQNFRGSINVKRITRK